MIMIMLNKCEQLWATRAAQALDACLTNHVVSPSVCKPSFRLHTQLVTPNHWLVTANEYVINSQERHAAAVRPLSKGTNDNDQCLCIAAEGHTIQTINFPMHKCIHEYSW